jgi:DNA-directed RNA polymerase specialized sigma24 family protein
MADPERMADEVFERLVNCEDPNFTDFYAAVDAVVTLTYARHAAKESTLDRLTRGMKVSRPGPTDAMLLVLSNLRHKHRQLLQLRYWDALTPAEAAEALQLTAESFAEREAKAEERFMAKATRRYPELAGRAVGPLVSAAKPGTHRRRVE